MLHAGFTELDCVAVTEFSSQCLRSRRTDPLMKNRIMHQAVTAMTLMTASLLPNEQRPNMRNIRRPAAFCDAAVCCKLFDPFPFPPERVGCHKCPDPRLWDFAGAAFRMCWRLLQ